MIFYTQEQVDRFRRFHDVTPNGVVFNWGLAGPDGAWFHLIREAHHTAADINEAKAHLRRQRDVVSITIAHIGGPPAGRISYV